MVDPGAIRILKVDPDVCCEPSNPMYSRACPRHTIEVLCLRPMCVVRASLLLGSWCLVVGGDQMVVVRRWRGAGRGFYRYLEVGEGSGDKDVVWDCGGVL